MEAYKRQQMRTSASNSRLTMSTRRATAPSGTLAVWRIHFDMLVKAHIQTTSHQSCPSLYEDLEGAAGSSRLTAKLLASYACHPGSHNPRTVPLSTDFSRAWKREERSWYSPLAFRDRVKHVFLSMYFIDIGGTRIVQLVSEGEGALGYLAGMHASPYPSLCISRD